MSQHNYHFTLPKVGNTPGEIFISFLKSIRDLDPTGMASTVVNVNEAKQNIDQSDFFKKCFQVIKDADFDQLSYDQLQDLIKKIDELTDKYQGDEIVNIFTKIDNKEKGDVLASIFKARLYKQISPEDFSSLTSMIINTPYNYFDNLQKYIEDYYEPSISEKLCGEGVVRSYRVEDGMSDTYTLTYNGMHLLKFLRTDIDPNLQARPEDERKVKAGLYWEEWE